MRRSILTPAAALVAAVTLSCGEQPGPLDSPDTSPPSFRTEQNPEGPGAFAIHVPEGFFGTFDDDPAPGLTTVVGITFAELVQFCATGEFPTILDRLLVFRPDG